MSFIRYYSLLLLFQLRLITSRWISITGVLILYTPSLLSKDMSIGCTNDFVLSFQASLPTVSLYVPLPHALRWASSTSSSFRYTLSTFPNMILGSLSVDSSSTRATISPTSGEYASSSSSFAPSALLLLPTLRPKAVAVSVALLSTALLIFADDFRRSYVCRCSLREWRMLLANSSISSSFLPRSDSITWVTNEDRSALHPISASVWSLNAPCRNLFHSAELRNGAPPSLCIGGPYVPVISLYPTPLRAHHKQVLMVVIPDQERPLPLTIYH